MLTLICGTNVEEGFGLAFRIIQDFNLSTAKVYGITAKYLSGNNRLHNIEQFVNCIKSNNDQGGSDAGFCDDILSLSVNTVVSAQVCTPQIKVMIDTLIRMIGDVGVRINCHIISGQLKSAYLLAIQNNRLTDVRKILRQAELTNQTHIKRLCERKLNIIK